MAEGSITIILDPKTGEADCDVEFPANECEEAGAVLEAVLEMLGLDATQSGPKERKPRQMDGVPHRNRVRGAGGSG